MKVTFTPAPLQAQQFPAGTASGALVVAMAIDAFSASLVSDGLAPTVFTDVPEGEGALTYGRRNGDDSDWLGTPFTVAVDTRTQVSIDMPVGGAVAVAPNDA